MEQESENVIASYTDRQALEDGVLVAVSAFPVNRVTRAVFDRYAKPLMEGVISDITPLLKAIRSMLAIEPDSDDWRVGSYEGQTLWLVPNEVSGLTLMFPEDY